MPVAIVTGGASGIGLAVVKMLVSKGYKVAIADMNEEAGAKVVADLGENTFFVKTNVASWESQKELFATTYAKWGSIDYVAANAGIDDKFSLVDPVDVSELQEPNLITLDVDLKGPIYSTYLAVNYMRLNGTTGGSIVITSSNAGLYPLHTNPIYTAAKHGVVGLIRALAPRYAPDKVRINCVCPAFVPTNLAPKELLANFPKEHITPMETVVRAFQNFAEDESLTGQVAHCSLEDIFYRDMPPFPNESERWMYHDSGKIWSAGYKQLKE